MRKLEISRPRFLSNIKSNVLLERATRAHGGRSQEFLALLNGEDAGLLSYEDWSDQAVGFIYEIFVLPSFRQQGVGAFLMSHAEHHAVQLKCRCLRLRPYALDQEPERDQLIGWYSRMGYVLAPNDPDHMEKHLPMRIPR